MTEHIAITAGLAIAAIMALSSALAPLCRLLRQPVVVGQLAAGIGLGMLPHRITGAVFPAASLPFLNVISQIGLVLFLFRVGYEIDLRSRRDYRRGIFAVAAGGFAPSMLLGVALAALLGGTSRWAALPGVPRGSFVLFIAVAMSITAVPVLACILAEHDIVTTRPGIVAMSSAGMLDVVGWLLLTVAISAAGMSVAPATVALGLLGYVAGMLFVARPALRRLVLAPGAARILPETAVIPFVLLSAWCTAQLGLHPFSGALLAGVVMPRNTNGAPDAGLVTTVEKTSSILLPVFFVVTGMTLRAGALDGSDLWLLAVVCVLATAGKLGGSALAARASRMTWRDSLTVGVLMNTRGLTELIAINAGRQAGLIGTSLYTILVLMALVTTALTGPLLALLRTRKSQNMYLERHEILTPSAEKSKSLQFPSHHGTLGRKCRLNGWIMSGPVNVLVIGGGPAGSIAATLLAQRGATVQLLEREFFPRYHIGESVSPSCRSIIDLAGAHEKIDARGYTVKNGLLLRWGSDRDWTVNWPDTFGGDVRAWQVDRADFDQVLLEHAASQGVAVHEGATAKAVTFDGSRAVGAEWLHAGRRHSGRFDYVVDASGRAGLLSAQHFKNRQPNEVFRNVAIWGYYQGGELLPGTPAGGINVISSPEGWYWVIPLSGDLFSVGFVTHQTWFLQRKSSYPSLNAMFADLVAESETVADLVRGGHHDGKVRVEQDFSYSASRYCGPGYFIAGDAACFLDPLLSTGVHLALYSGMLAATSILATRNGDVTELEAQGFFESLYRNAYSRLFAMVAGFYQKYRGRAGYFWLAQRLARGQLAGGGNGAHGGAFAAVTAGLTDLHDASRVGGTAPLAELAAAAVQAGERASAAVPAAGNTLAPMMMDANDLYDAATGLYLVTSPTLGIRRAARVPAAATAP